MPGHENTDPCGTQAPAFRLLRAHRSKVHRRLGQLVAVGVVSFAACRIAARTPVDLGDSCANCAIEWTRRVSLEDVPDAPLEIPTHVAFDGRRYFVVGVNSPYAINSYSQTGEFLDRLARRGQGPGEFGLLVSVVPTARGIIVLDRLNARWTELSPDFQVLGEHPIEFPAQSRGHIRLADGLWWRRPAPTGASWRHLALRGLLPLVLPRVGRAEPLVARP